MKIEVGKSYSARNGLRVSIKSWLDADIADSDIGFLFRRHDGSCPGIPDLDIIAEWSDEMNTQETIRKLEQSIDEAKKQIDELKKQQTPTAKVGQVWQFENSAKPVRLIVSNGDKFFAIDLEHNNVADTRDSLDKLRVVDEGRLVADSLEEYFANKRGA